MRRHLTYANVMATLALVVAVGGGTAAIAGKRKAPKNSVVAKSIRDGNITANKLAGIRVETQSGAGPTTATCASSERLVGGGGNITGDPQGRFLGSYPQGNGWTINGFVGPIGAQLTAYALCLRATPGT